MKRKNAKEAFWKQCQTEQQLWKWVECFQGIRVPRRPVCPGHSAPFDYLKLAYFEPATDLVVWAPRGGGKTRLGAVATLLDLIHKPGCAVRILGGSLEQSLKMWEHLCPELLRNGVLPDRRGNSRRANLPNGSSVGILTQSQRAVRGLRVQKLRCDEVELFDPRVWEAAQLVTRSKGRDKAFVAGAVEAISTWHTIGGLMERVVEGAAEGGAKVVKWCLLEVLERCHPHRNCDSCPLWNDCRGIAKTCNGFVKIDDAIAMKRRVSQEAWESEMLCRRPAARKSVFPSFDPEIHLAADERRFTQMNGDLWLAIDFGFANAFVCLWILRGDGDVAYVLDEYVQPMRTVDEHLPEIEGRPWGKARRVACDPAGAARNEQTAMSNVQLLRSRAYVVKFRRSLIMDGLEMIRAALRPAAGEPRLFIHPRCKRLIAALRGYRYAEGGGEVPIKDGEHDHLIDAALLLREPRQWRRRRLAEVLMPRAGI